MTELARNPGSFSQFVESAGIDPTAEDAVYQYSDALHAFHAATGDVVKTADATPRVEALLLGNIVRHTTELIEV